MDVHFTKFVGDISAKYFLKFKRYFQIIFHQILVLKRFLVHFVQFNRQLKFYPWRLPFVQELGRGFDQ